MSELKEVEYPNCFGSYYRKDEADKVIAEKDERIDLYKRGWEESDRINTSIYKEIRYQKYKRCLVMAKWCYAKWDDTATKYYKSVWYRKWEVKWLALAEKFKGAK